MANWFHDTWLESEKEDSEWEQIFCAWSEVPERDEEWYRRTKLKFRGQPWLFYQEYPSNTIEAFARSGRSVYGYDLINPMPFQPPLARFGWTGMAFDLQQALAPGEDSDLTLRVWEFPTVERHPDGRLKRAPNYVVFCDPAEGLTHGDYTAVTVWDANQRRVVATIRTHWPIEYMGDVLAWVGYYYHTALLMVERNNHGLVPLTQLAMVLYYPRLYRQAFLAQIPQGDRTPRYGWHTNTSTKPKMVHDFMKALRDNLDEEGNLKPNAVLVLDPDWKIEAQSFVADGKGSYSAVAPNHDDLMISVIGGWQGVLEVGQYPIVWHDDRPGPPTWADVLAVTVPQRHKKGSGSVHVGQSGTAVTNSRRSITLWALDGDANEVKAPQSDKR
jgi:hypothetical protein